MAVDFPGLDPLKVFAKWLLSENCDIADFPLQHPTT